MSGRERVPSFFLLVPGPWQKSTEVVEALALGSVTARVSSGQPVEAGDISVDVVQDDFLAQGFAMGRLAPTPPELIQQIATCSHAVLVEMGMRFAEALPTLVKLSHALRDGGGLAVRLEESGCAWTWEAWLHRLASDDPSDLYHCATLVVSDGDVAFTRGMHCFDLPDAQIDMPDDSAAIGWLDTFCVFQIAEQPVLGSGHSFRPEAEAGRRFMERWPDHRHLPDDGRHNPFGLWRFLPEGARTVSVSDPVPKIIPSLVALTTRAEQSAGRPLTRSEVENLVKRAPAVVMELAHSNALDRSRGYADIEPELAWEQWQIVRDRL